MLVSYRPLAHEALRKARHRAYGVGELTDQSFPVSKYCCDAHERFFKAFAATSNCFQLDVLHVHGRPRARAKAHAPLDELARPHRHVQEQHVLLHAGQALWLRQAHIGPPRARGRLPLARRSSTRDPSSGAGVTPSRRSASRSTPPSGRGRSAATTAATSSRSRPRPTI